MKILAIGDFHGKFPKKFEKIAKDCDIILSTGDFANIDKIREIIFKHWTAKRWWEIIGLKKAKEIEKESFDSGLKVLKKLNSLGKKVYIIWGNSDFYKTMESSEPKSLNPGYYNNEIKKLKNLILIERKKGKINGTEIIGHGGYLDVTDFIKNPIDKDKKKQKKRLKRYKKSEEELKQLFLKEKPKDFIFLIHYTPYKIFDKVKFKKSPMYGKNVGWEPYNQVIKKYKPKLVICGHMHEYQGIKKLGKTSILATGSAAEGKAAIIDIDKKIKVRFIK